MGIEEGEIIYGGIKLGTKTVSHLESPEATTIDADPMNTELPLDGVPGDSTSDELSDQVVERSLGRIINTFFSTLRN